MRRSNRRKKKIKPKIKVKKNKPAKKQLDKPAKEDDELIKSLKRTIAAHEKNNQYLEQNPRTSKSGKRKRRIEGDDAV